MEEINPQTELEKTHNITAISEIRKELGSAVSATDVWFPHISKHIVITWGHQSFKDYTKTLFSTTRNNRQGFPSEVLIELMDIDTLHDKLFPQFIPLV